MPKDVVITPASGNVVFRGDSGNVEALIELTNDGLLNIQSSNAGVVLGNPSTDVYIGDGVNSIDIIFEQNGEIRALTGKTLTFGQSDSFIAVAANITGIVNYTGNIFTGNITVSGISRLGTVAAGTWQGSSISTTYTDAKITAVAGQTGAISNAQLLAALSAVDGVGSGLDADVLDGLAGGGAGAYALKANNLSVFASTTSAQLAGVISDETGSGSLVFATSPTLAGTPQAPTAAIGTANAMIATTEFASNASALASGVVPPARVVGNYTSITGVGTIGTGTWQGSSISTTYTDAKVTSVMGATGNVILTTSNIAEGSNQYFTNARSRSAISSGTGVIYNNSTGVISIGQSVGTSNDVTFANVTVTGNLLVQGNAIQFTSNTLVIQDPLIQVGVNPTGDATDLGFFGHYIGGSPSIERHAGLFRDATDGQFKLFTNLDPEPTTIVDTANATYQSANLVVNFVVGKVTDISNHTTTNLAEGTNLYFTNTRAIGAFTGGSGISIASNGLLTSSVTGGVTSVAGATGDVSNAQILAGLLTVDGVGSGLDADTLDGLAGGGAGAYALKANNLSVFASTTSAQLAGVISDETGSGNLVFNASPTFTGTPLAPTAAIGTANTMIATTAFASNASALASGVINPARVVGSYTSITGVGTIAAGTWQGSSISTTYTDAKLTSVAATSPIATSGATGSITLSHVNSGVAAATYGNATIIPVITVNATGHVTSVANVAVAASGGGGGGGGDFNTAINGAAAANVTTVLTSFFTAPADAGKRYVVRSVQVTNVSGAIANVTADFSGTTYSSIAFAHTIPVPSASAVELLKRPKVMQPSDSLRLQSTANSALQAVITYETIDEAKHFGAGIDLTSAATLTTLHTATANSVIESILLSNDDGGLDVKARVAWTNASDTVLAYLAYDLIVPADATVEVIDAPKFLQNGFKIRVEANQANRLEAIIAGKTV